ncbi:ComF family protein [Nocardia sp. FBN12]|uniref:ComF family protein n=1 Tax=Nocardia sp. FBN12 TaxID=3419766 RepID=UPI003D058DFA
MPSSSPHDIWDLLGFIRDAISATYHNTYLTGVCEVCRGQVYGTERCEVCQAHVDEYGDRLADQTILLTYVEAYHKDGYHQSVHDLTYYKGKDGVPPSEDLLGKLGAMFSAAGALHADCFRASRGSEKLWDAVTFIPSVRYPSIDHPVSRLANSMKLAISGWDPKWVFLAPHNMGDKHKVTVDRFLVPPVFEPVVKGASVLVVDDTWTTGANVQSASLALKAAGAQSVTGLCVARWQDWRYQNQLCASLSEPYSPQRCPVGVCS